MVDPLGQGVQGSLPEMLKDPTLHANGTVGVIEGIIVGRCVFRGYLDGSIVGSTDAMGLAVTVGKTDA